MLEVAMVQQRSGFGSAQEPALASLHCTAGQTRNTTAKEHAVALPSAPRLREIPSNERR